MMTISGLIKAFTVSKLINIEFSRTSKLGTKSFFLDFSILRRSLGSKPCFETRSSRFITTDGDLARPVESSKVHRKVPDPYP